MRGSRIVLLAFAASASGLPTSGPKVASSYGTWYGKTFLEVDSFRGIPFAQPPVGELRFAPPLATKKNYGDFDATKSGKSCPQMNLLAGALPGVLNVLGTTAFDLITQLPVFRQIAAADSSEDCLNINVQRPTGTSATAKLPVMFWIFGGAFQLGGTSMYDATSIVRRSVANGQPVIVVAANHRVNSFGFLPGKEVANDPTASVNAGLQDQRLALEWVQDNIALFGGDPTKVTIFGESSGAISASLQMLAFDGDTSYKGKPLFRAAIMQSGAPIPVEGTARGQSSYDAIAKGTGCFGSSTPIACLRAVPYEKLVAATNALGNILSYDSVSLPFLPRTDGKFLTAQAPALLAAGKYPRIPIISGNQYDEGTILTLGTLNITTESQLSNWLSTRWFPNAAPAEIKQILVNYPQDVTQGSPFNTGILNVLTPQNKRINAIVGDVVFQAGRRSFVTALTPTQPVWSYVSRVFYALPLLGSFHLSDILAVWGYLPTDPSTEMQSRWIAFATTLNPNVRGYTNWPNYGSDATLLQFTELGSGRITDSFRTAGIAYFNAISTSLAL